MGTRSNTIIKDERGEVLCNIYRQFDGYLSGHGNDLKEILGDCKIINGFGMDDKAPKQFNGMGCLAAYLVGQLKGESIGGIYLDSPSRVTEPGVNDYTYVLSPGTDGGVVIKAYHWEDLIFEGKLTDLSVEETEDA